MFMCVCSILVLICVCSIFVLIIISTNILQHKLCVCGIARTGC